MPFANSLLRANGKRMRELIEDGELMKRDLLDMTGTNAALSDAPTIVSPDEIMCYGDIEDWCTRVREIQRAANVL
jgi:hypothetical protein